MKFKNDNQAKEFLQNYKKWGHKTTDNFFNRTVYVTELFGLEIVAEETACIGMDVKYENGKLTSLEKSTSFVQYYIVPDGGKHGKPMHEYRVSMSYAIKMLREADKKYD